MPLINSENLIIDWLCEEDRQLFIELYTDPKLMRHIALPLTVERASKSFLLTLKKKSCLHFTIRQKAHSNPVGMVALNFESIEQSVADLGVMLKRDFHRKDIARESVQAVIKYVFEAKVANKLKVKIDQKNKPTIRLMKQLGFTEAERNERFIFGELSSVS